MDHLHDARVETTTHNAGNRPITYLSIDRNATGKEDAAARPYTGKGLRNRLRILLWQL